MRQTLSRTDHQLTVLLQGRPLWLRPFMVIISITGHPLLITPLAFVLSVASFRVGNTRLSYVLLLGCVAVLANGVLKLALRRARPDTVYAKKMWPQTYSFPSGHAFTAIVLYGLVAYLSVVYLPVRWSMLIVPGVVALIVAVGLSRIYLGAHYVLDIVGGWLLGGMVLLFLINLAGS